MNKYECASVGINSIFSTYMGIPFEIVKSLAKVLEDNAYAVSLVCIRPQIIKLSIEINHLCEGIQRQELVLLLRLNTNLYPLYRRVASRELILRLFQ